MRPGFGSWELNPADVPAEEREFHVLVEREVQGWVKVRATSQNDAYAAAAAIPIKELPTQRVRRFTRHAQALTPRTRYGRVLVLRANDVCGGEPYMKVLYLDCGHVIWIPAETWFPSNPWVECTNTNCPSRS